MANLPIPVGLGAMMREIAEGVGTAARILPGASRSAVGAVAVKRASVEIDFEMTASVRNSDGTVGIGARTFLIGSGVSTSAVETRARNSGRIALEIVAIAEAEPAPPARPSRPEKPVVAPAPSPPLDAGEVKAALEQLRAQIAQRLAAGLVDQSAATEARGLANEAELRLSAGDLAGAAERLRAAAQLIGS